MESELFINLLDISWEILVGAFIVFGLTMLIKWPIKKTTSKLEENKRKAVNTVIVFIPMVLAIVLSGLYYGLLEQEWFTGKVFEFAGSIYVLALAFYAIYSRIIIVIKGVKSSSEIGANLSKETISFIKQNIKTISKTLKVDESNLEKVVEKIDNLLKIRDELVNNLEYQDITATENIDNQVSSLRLEENSLKDNITLLKEQLLNYQNTITSKGE